MEWLSLEQYGEPEAAKRAARVLREGGVIIFPAERLYGVGASVLSGAAIRRVQLLKDRSPEVPLPVVSCDMEMTEEWVEMPEPARCLADRFWPGLLTLVLDLKSEVPPELVGGSSRLGIRVPGNRLSRDISRILGLPYTATSSNLSGGEPGRTALDAVSGLCGDVDLVLDGGRLAGPPPSTVVEVDKGSVLIKREGAISSVDIVSV